MPPFFIRTNACAYGSKDVPSHIMMKSILIVGMGSFAGGALRYYLSTLFKGWCGQGFPYATLAVNLIGCFAFGMLFALFQRADATYSPWCLLLTTGLCGGFTTFSTFSHESMTMLQSGNYMGLAIYIAASVILGIALVAAGAAAVN